MFLYESKMNTMNLLKDRFIFDSFLPCQSASPEFIVYLNFLSFQANFNSSNNTNTITNNIRLFSFFFYFIVAAVTIKCYQCSSADTINCSDLMLNQPDSPLQPEDCSSVINARFCIKSTALNG